MNDPIAARYEAELRAAQSVRDDTGRRSRTLANTRLLVFALGGAVLLGSIGFAGGLPMGSAVVVALSAVAFVALVNLHDRVERQHRRAQAEVDIRHEALQRYHRRWADLPDPSAHTLPSDHPYANDLDLAGHASLQQLIGRVETAPGRKALIAWLAEPASPTDIEARQQAVRELAQDRPFRDTLELEARLHRPTSAANTEPFLAWADDEPRYTHRTWLRWIVWIAPAALISAIVARLAGWTALPLWVIPFTVNVAITTWLREAVNRTYTRAFSAAKAIDQYTVLFRMIEDGRFRASFLQHVQERLTQGGVAAHRAMQRLARLSALADVRLSMFHFPIQLLTLWDAHLLLALERWQTRPGHHAREWLDSVGEAEAIAALASLKDDHPDWTFPEVKADADWWFEGKALGHPLLANDERVCNDVTLGPEGTFLLVTGSNMSGKSTLLRAIGCNVVLAQAGGPVCAAALRMRPVSLYTSMRIADSLEAGLSYFMAGLTRLKQVVDTARNAERRGGRTLLYLLDEILQGTNTAERQIAVRRIITHLLAEGAIGAVTTHDLALAKIPELQSASEPVFFTETVETAGMTFDYTLRPGVATSRNALRLMELIGIEAGESHAPKGN